MGPVTIVTRADSDRSDLISIQGAARVPQGIWGKLLFSFALVCWLGQPLFAAEKFTNADCLDCHLDPTTTRTIGTNIVPLLFPTNTFIKSIHANLDCIDCHEGIKDLVHESKLPPPNCASCHEQEGKEYATSKIGRAHV